MLSKFGPDQNAACKQCRSKSSESRHGLQARREHDACTTERMPFPCSAEGSAAPLEMTVSRGSSTRGVFKLRGSGKSDSVASAAPRRQRTRPQKLPDEATHGEPGHDG